ncbi:aspartate aminotransferase [Mariannaea sp. PMI_226]|nr:aspartate aminotransferase [Mariannaea sp. PMI_226]
MTADSQSASPSAFQAKDLVSPDVQFDVTRRFLADDHPDKINLGQGTYRDDNGQPWVLPSVQMAKAGLGDFNHEYLPILGLKAYRDEATQLLYKGTRALAQNRIASCQSLSGTGALLLVGLALKRLSSASKDIYVTDPTWVNHRLLFATIGYNVAEIPCYKDGAFDFDAYMTALRKATPGSPIVLHTCAHNPTGCDPTREQWMAIGAIVKERRLFPIFDSAYLGFNSGSFDEDAWPIYYFLEKLDVELAVCLSMAKNMGLYGERIGLVSFATSSQETARIAESVLESVQRGTITAPPAYGARVAAKVLSTSSIREQWQKDLVTMSSRIRLMRKRVYDELVRLQTPGDWSRIMNQTGMFAYLGISKTQIRHLEEQHHVFMVETSRVSVAGLNESNVRRFAKALDQTLRNIE